MVGTKTTADHAGAVRSSMLTLQDGSASCPKMSMDIMCRIGEPVKACMMLRLPEKPPRASELAWRFTRLMLGSPYERKGDNQSPC